MDNKEIIERAAAPSIDNSLNLITKSGASFAGEALALRAAGFNLRALKAYVPAIEKAAVMEELIRAFEGGSYYHEPLLLITCCVCSSRVFKAKGTWWLPICCSCHDKGWKSEPYYGNNYGWEVFLDHDSKTAHAIEE